MAIENKIITIIGHKGYGKTKLTEIIALANNRPTIIADPRRQYDENNRRRLFETVGALRSYIMDRNNFTEFYRCKLELVVHVQDDAFDDLVRLVEKMRRITFVVDEIDIFAPTTITNKAPFYKLIHYGRHLEIDIITTSRRPANISRNITSQTDIHYFSRIREPNDKDYIKRYIGKEWVKVVEEMPKFTFLHIDEDLNINQVHIPKHLAHLV